MGDVELPQRQDNVEGAFISEASIHDVEVPPKPQYTLIEEEVVGTGDSSYTAGSPQRPLHSAGRALSMPLALDPHAQDNGVCFSEGQDYEDSNEAGIQDVIPFGSCPGCPGTNDDANSSDNSKGHSDGHDDSPDNNLEGGDVTPQLIPDANCIREPGGGQVVGMEAVVDMVGMESNHREEDQTEDVNILAGPAARPSGEDLGRELLHAAEQGNWGNVPELISLGANPGLTNASDGNTALHYAAIAGNTEAIESLIEAGALVGAPNHGKGTALHCAASNGHTHSIQQLIDSNADPMARGDDGGTALHAAAWHGHDSAVQVLLKNRANPGAEAHDKTTPLHNAATHGFYDIVSNLVQANADPTVEDARGATALSLATAQGHTDIVCRAINRGLRNQISRDLIEVLGDPLGESGLLATATKATLAERRAEAGRALLDASIPVADQADKVATTRRTIDVLKSKAKEANSSALALAEQSTQLEEAQDILRERDVHWEASLKALADHEQQLKYLKDQLATRQHQAGSMNTELKKCCLTIRETDVDNALPCAPAQLSALASMGARTCHAARADLEKAEAATLTALKQLKAAALAEQGALDRWIPRLESFTMQATKHAVNVAAAEAQETPAAETFAATMEAAHVKWRLTELAAVDESRGEARVAANKLMNYNAVLDELEMKEDEEQHRLETRRVKEDQAKKAEVERNLQSIRAELDKTREHIRTLESTLANPLLRLYFPDLRPKQAPCSGISESLVDPEMTLDELTRNCSPQVLYMTTNTVVTKYSRNGEDFVVKSQRNTETSVREIRRLQSIRHPLIAEISRVFCTNEGEICLVMPFYSGGTMRTWMEDVRGRSECGQDVQRRMREVITAVSYLHRNGVVHRDLKPENILIGDDDRIRIADFGIARDLHACFQTATQVAAGTLVYMSPEAGEPDGVWRTQPHSVDMWAIGIMLAELLSGEMFWWDPRLRAVVSKSNGAHLFGPADAPMARHGDGWDLVKALLAQDPSMRPMADDALLMPYFTRETSQAGTHNATDPPSVAFASLHALLRAERAAAAAATGGYTTVNINEDDGPIGLLAAIAELDTSQLAHSLRVLVGSDVQPLSQTALACLCHVFDPINGKVDNSGLPVRTEDNSSEVLWHSLGRLLAKCLMDGVPVRPTESQVFYELLIVGLGKWLPSIAAVRDVDADLASQFQGVLDQNHRNSAPEHTVCVDRFVGGGPPGALVTERNKHEVVRGWIRAAVLDGRERDIDAMHRGFSTAFSWQPQLQAIASCTDDLRSLLDGGDDLPLDTILATVRPIAEDDDRAVQHACWIREFLTSCSSPILRQFWVRAVGFHGLDVDTMSLCVAVDESIQSVHFAGAGLLVLPLCATVDELATRLRDVLNVADREMVPCPTCCEDNFARAGLECSRGHFYCGGCAVNLVQSQCSEPVEERARPDRAGLVCCVYCRSDGEEVAIDRKEIFRVGDNETRERYNEAEKEVDRHFARLRATAEAQATMRHELAQLAAMDADERQAHIHRRHITDQILTNRCPREGCGLVFLDYEGCAALYCRCECGFCAICFEDCGRDAHDHIAQSHQNFRGIFGHYYVPQPRIAEHWQQRKTDLVTEYLMNIADVGERQRALEACQDDLADLDIHIDLA